MDLWQRGLRREANMMFNRYLDHSPEDEGAVGLMALFMSVRACIRAHVSAARAKRGGDDGDAKAAAHYHAVARSEEHTSELQSLMRNSYADSCLKKKKTR